ncbi:MAG: NADH-quinone oxidoreductase subunit L [Verrucomicrobiae bacterium]|nr:NADH-quinone oxidoreductase subunit L [Verrucomicrobiae bacterium]
MDLTWIILFAPLAAAIIITLFTLRDKRLSAAISIGGALISFICAAITFCDYTNGQAPTPASFNWIDVGALTVPFCFVVDNLSMLMLLVVTGVSSAIFVYSYGYMHDDRGNARYFASLSLFLFSMIGIVLSSNFIMMFIFWELVGVSSYLLIGHWYERETAADAAKKAFITNRVGDFGFMLGILMVWMMFGSVSFDDIGSALANKPNVGLMTAAALLIFCGAVGKSAQFPLHVWLPDAMEGPTPVSALIHAATMVAAGVYMLCRVFFLLQWSPDALHIIAWIGGITALMAALIAVVQNDIKRVLAYSTLSQLGYMVMSVGLSGYSPAMFHLSTHAFFKALLFLGAGSVIFALHHEQDIWKMGGLWKKLPWTFWTFTVGTLALCGCPFLSGFFSKDEILAVAWEHNKALFALGVFTAGLTAFYMFRLWLVTFFGEARDKHVHEHAHESPAVMILPLIFLAILSIGGGYFGIAEFFQESAPKLAGEVHYTLGFAIGVSLVPLLGALLAVGLYKGKVATDPLRGTLPGYGVLENKFYFDRMYQWLIDKVQGGIAGMSEVFDHYIIDGLGVRGLTFVAEWFGRGVRCFQTGNLQAYAFLLGVGVIAILYFVLR